MVRYRVTPPIFRPIVRCPVSVWCVRQAASTWPRCSGGLLEGGDPGSHSAHAYSCQNQRTNSRGKRNIGTVRAVVLISLADNGTRAGTIQHQAGMIASFGRIRQPGRAQVQQAVLGTCRGAQVSSPRRTELSCHLIPISSCGRAILCHPSPHPLFTPLYRALFEAPRQP